MTKVNNIPLSKNTDGNNGYLSALMSGSNVNITNTNTAEPWTVDNDNMNEISVNNMDSMIMIENENDIITTNATNDTDIT